jgi:uncharacterized protein (TIGR02271 family)
MIKHSEGDNSLSFRLREEELDIKKERHQLANVQFRRETVTEERTIIVPVSREELVVEKDGVEIYRIPIWEERIEHRTYPVELERVKVYTEEFESEVSVEETLLREAFRYSIEGNAEVIEQNSDAPVNDAQQ